MTEEMTEFYFEIIKWFTGYQRDKVLSKEKISFKKEISLKLSMLIHTIRNM